VEIRGLLAGTRFKIVERPTEMPDGYSFQKYIYSGNDEAPAKGSADVVASKGVSDIIEAGSDPHVDICNLKGWGLRMNKTWSDEGYMEERGPAYFAVFTRAAGTAQGDGTDQSDGTAGDSLTLVPGTVRQLKGGEHTLYWYFLPLPVNVPFDQYEIREVELENPTVAEDGTVTEYGKMTQKADGDTVLISGKQKGEEVSSLISYTVSYEKGTPDADSNVRTDIVTNSRPGIILNKEDWDGIPLQGAQFTLTDENGSEIGSFTSDVNGRITMAFLREGENAVYRLTETKAPAGYCGLTEPMTLQLKDGKLSVGYADSGYYRLESDSAGTQVLTVKNRPYRFRALKEGVKHDGSVVYLSGVHFALHREATVETVTTMVLQPLAGFEDLVSEGGEGVIPKVDETLPAGRTYYLKEKEAPAGYLALSEPVKFTLNDNGTVTLSENAEAELKEEEAKDGTLIRTLVVKNFPAAAAVRVVKISQNGPALEGAEFSLTGTGIQELTGLVSKIPEGGKDAVIYENPDLPAGTYRLTETKAPDGYLNLLGPVEIQVQSTGTGILVKGFYNGKEISPPDVRKDEASGVWTVTVINQSGYEMPSTGGPGTAGFTLAGLVLIFGIGAVYLSGRKTSY